MILNIARPTLTTSDTLSPERNSTYLPDIIVGSVREMVEIQQRSGGETIRQSPDREAQGIRVLQS